MLFLEKRVNTTFERMELGRIYNAASTDSVAFFACRFMMWMAVMQVRYRFQCHFLAQLLWLDSVDHFDYGESTHATVRRFWNDTRFPSLMAIADSLLCGESVRDLAYTVHTFRILQVPFFFPKFLGFSCESRRLKTKELSESEVSFSWACRNIFRQFYSPRQQDNSCCVSKAAVRDGSEGWCRLPGWAAKVMMSFSESLTCKRWN